MIMSSNNQTLVPLIAQYAEKQIEIPVGDHGYYDEQKEITVLTGQGTPLVEANPSVASTMTKSEVARETEDTSLVNLPEFMTKTAVSRESDDTQCGLAELATKTRAEREKEDEQNHLLGILTITKIARESTDTAESIGLI